MKVSADVCPLCEGTGWKSVSIGSDRRVTRCDCRRQARTQTLLAAARIPKRYEHCELSNFDFDGAHRQLFPARMAACKFVEEYPLDGTGLMLIGSIGVGKTHLAVGIIKELVLSKGIACLFYDYRELLKQIQNSYNDSVKATELDVLRPGIRHRGAGARRTGRGQTDRMGLGHGQPDPEHPLQCQTHDDHHHQPAQSRVNASAIAVPTSAAWKPRNIQRRRKHWATASASACFRGCTKCAASSRWRAQITAEA